MTSSLLPSCCSFPLFSSFSSSLILLLRLSPSHFSPSSPFCSPLLFPAPPLHSPPRHSPRLSSCTWTVLYHSGPPHPEQSCTGMLILGCVWYVVLACARGWMLESMMHRMLGEKALRISCFRHGTMVGAQWIHGGGRVGRGGARICHGSLLPRGFATRPILLLLCLGCFGNCCDACGTVCDVLGKETRSNVPTADSFGAWCEACSFMHLSAAVSVQQGWCPDRLLAVMDPPPPLWRAPLPMLAETCRSSGLHSSEHVASHVPLQCAYARVSTDLFSRQPWIFGQNSMEHSRAEFETCLLGQCSLCPLQNTASACIS